MTAIEVNVIEPLRTERPFESALPPSCRPKRGSSAVTVQEAYTSRMPRTEQDRLGVKHQAFAPLTEDILLNPTTSQLVFLHQGNKPHRYRQAAGASSQIDHSTIWSTLDGLMQHLLGVRDGSPTIANLVKFLAWNFKESGYMNPLS